MIVDHICFAVQDINRAIQEWNRAFDYEQMTDPILNTRQQVRVVFLSKENSLTIKLIEPLKENESISAFVSKGGGFHHICFKCHNINEQMEKLKDKGLITLFAPQPGEAFENENIAFMLTKFGVNIELIDTDRRSGRINVDGN